MRSLTSCLPWPTLQGLLQGPDQKMYIRILSGTASFNMDQFTLGSEEGMTRTGAFRTTINMDAKHAHRIHQPPIKFNQIPPLLADTASIPKFRPYRTVSLLLNSGTSFTKVTFVKLLKFPASCNSAVWNYHIIIMYCYILYSNYYLSGINPFCYTANKSLLIHEDSS